MCQLPLLSHWAMASQVEVDAALAGAAARPTPAAVRATRAKPLAAARVLVRIFIRAPAGSPTLVPSPGLAAPLPTLTYSGRSNGAAWGSVKRGSTGVRPVRS